MLRGSGRLSGRRVALCVTGSIAAVECVRLARELRRLGARVQCYMTPAAAGILHPRAMEHATGEEVVTELTGRAEHLESFHLLVIAPATANTIAKVAHGVADNAVTSLALAAGCPVIIAPAMHWEMYESPRLRSNLSKLAERCSVVEPRIEEGIAKMAPIQEIIGFCIRALTEKELLGKKVLITAGPTAEPVDAVRVLMNRSSGKMGVALAREAWYRGAEVTLIYGPGCEPAPPGVSVIRVETAEEMARAVEEQQGYDIFIGAAAAADYTLERKPGKISSRAEELVLRLRRARRVLSAVREGALKVGFKAEYGVGEEVLVDRARALAREHGLHLVVANDLAKGAMGGEEAEVVLVQGDEAVKLERMAKAEIARVIFDRLKMA